MKLDTSASVEEVFAYLDKKPVVVLCFVDQSTFITRYLSSMQWLTTEVDLVEVDQEMLELFQIGKVPQFRFYLQGNEIASLIGTATREEFLEVKNKVLGNIEGIRK